MHHLDVAPVEAAILDPEHESRTPFDITRSARKPLQNVVGAR